MTALLIDITADLPRKQSTKKVVPGPGAQPIAPRKFSSVVSACVGQAAEAATKKQPQDPAS